MTQLIEARFKIARLIDGASMAADFVGDTKVISADNLEPILSDLDAINKALKIGEATFTEAEVRQAFNLVFTPLMVGPDRFGLINYVMTALKK